MRNRLAGLGGLVFQGAIGAFVAANVFLAWRWNQRPLPPPPWDPSVHLDTAMDYALAWSHGEYAHLLLTNTRPGHAAYPPVYHYSLIATFAAQDPQTGVVWLNLAYWLLLCLAAAYISARLGGPWSGTASLAILAFSPMLETYRVAFVDVALASWVMASYALLVRSELFERRASSLALGVCAGLAALSKWTALVYLFPCWLAGWRTAKSRRNLAGATVIAAVMVAPWYLLNGVNVFGRALASAKLGASEGDPTGFTVAAWSWYFGTLGNYFALPVVLLLLAGAAWALVRTRARGWARAETVVAAWLAFSYAFWSSVPNKDTRYIMPAAAALPALGAAGLPGPLLVAAVGAAAWHGLNRSWPATAKWPTEDMLAEVEARRAARGAGGSASLCVLANHESLNSTTLRWLARHRGWDRISIGCTESAIPEWADFVLVKTKDPGYYLGDQTLAILRDVNDPRSLFRRAFVEDRAWDLPDGSRAILYEPRHGLPAPSGTTRLASFRVRSALFENAVLRPSGRPGDYDLSAEKVTLVSLGDAPITGVKARLEGARLLTAGKQAYIIGISTVSLLSLDLAAPALAQALSRRTKLAWTVTAEDGALTASTRLGPLPVRLVASVRPTADGLEARVRELRLFGLPLVRDRALAVPLAARPPNQPYALKLAPITFAGQRISIGPSVP